jgi:molybdopterin converting factor small subunit
MEVRLFATLRINRDKTVSVAWHDGICGQDVLDMLGIDAKDVAVFLINGMHGKLDETLKESDIISLFPPVGGG